MTGDNRMILFEHGVSGEESRRRREFHDANERRRKWHKDSIQ